MNNSFKTFYKKEPSKKGRDKTVSDEIFSICRELRNKNPEQLPEEIFAIASEQYIESVISDVREKIDNSAVYVIDEIKSKLPVVINKDKEVLK